MNKFQENTLIYKPLANHPIFKYIHTLTNTVAHIHTPTHTHTKREIERDWETETEKRISWCCFRIISKVRKYKYKNIEYNGLSEKGTGRLKDL